MQATRSPRQSDRPDKHHEPAPQRQPEPRRPGEDKQRDARTPSGR